MNRTRGYKPHRSAKWTLNNMQAGVDSCEKIWDWTGNLKRHTQSSQTQEVYLKQPPGFTGIQSMLLSNKKLPTKTKNKNKQIRANSKLEKQKEATFKVHLNIIKNLSSQLKGFNDAVKRKWRIHHAQFPNGSGMDCLCEQLYFIWISFPFCWHLTNLRSSYRTHKSAVPGSIVSHRSCCFACAQSSYCLRTCQLDQYIWKLTRGGSRKQRPIGHLPPGSLVWQSNRNFPATGIDRQWHDRSGRGTICWPDNFRPLLMFHRPLWQISYCNTHKFGIASMLGYISS